MSKIKIIISSQYWENYAVGPEGFYDEPHWKPKVVEEQSNEACNYEYRSYEILWGEPTPLDSNEFQSKLEKEYE